MVPLYSVRITRVRTYSGYKPLEMNFAYRILTFSDRPSHAVRLFILQLMSVLTPENIAILGLASSAFARRYSQNLV